MPECILDLQMGVKWTEYFELNNILLYNNPLKSPPIEIVIQGKEAIKRYFEKIKKEGTNFINEAKLILVGEGASGKTSLQYRLKKTDSILPLEDERTRGITIEDWNFDSDNKHIAHIWDFGGQNVYYPVHRFFLTENSVFLLLASTRISQHNFDYWIPTIFQFGGKSPIILGQTCHKGNKVKWNDIGQFVSNPDFNIIKTQEQPYYEINLPNNNEGLENIKKIIIDQILSLPHYGKEVPNSWLPVRERLQEESRTHPCITFDRFDEICRQINPESFKNQADIEDCGNFLHSIGAILWYQNFNELKDILILQPEWAVKAVYKIIDDEEIQNRHGLIMPQDFTRLWAEECFNHKHLILKKMLEVFKIGFPKKHNKDEFIIPARQISLPTEKKWDDKNMLLRIEYTFEFMPKGLINQLSSGMSRYITNDEEVWNNAVNLSTGNNTAHCQVEEDFYNRKIKIKAKGKDARGIIMMVMNELKDITDGYKGVIPKINVPCICHECLNNTDPQVFSYDVLLEKISKKPEATVTCNVSDEVFRIETLLFEIGLPNPVKEQRERERNRCIKIFIASSSELKDDRKEFELAIRQKNDIWSKKGLYLEPVMWENFIDYMSQSRLQEEYNKAVRESDIFVMLFFSKVGKYTEEEFETAFGQFKQSGNPFIYTYFKNAHINTGDINERDTNSLLSFKNKLNQLGHYLTEYKNTEGLILHFVNQLEKLESMFIDPGKEKYNKNIRLWGV